MYDIRFPWRDSNPGITEYKADLQNIQHCSQRRPILDLFLMRKIHGYMT